MRTLLIILAIWLLINVLFVVVMIPPHKSRRRGVIAGMTAGPSETHAESVSLRHAIIAIALDVFFSLTPPFIEAYDAIRGLVGKRRSKSKKPLDPSDR
ncbi:hypothetical protein QY049_26790 [Bradyrhizobium sp. WYCCWR 13022]|uniref:hypothetical protein n=1 Tax=unclassified Bradyrhizobium TaxID=2631580 RepID=UPI00263B89C8|nr:hypothetical protein [Bradyrhizobium sp. WYCCWR 13022]MDN4986773.1 hypothetical protein [Bradyrhizobium sp. WYCCWR 13022]